VLLFETRSSTEWGSVLPSIGGKQSLHIRRVLLAREMRPVMVPHSCEEGLFTPRRHTGHYHASEASMQVNKLLLINRRLCSTERPLRVRRVVGSV